jgi:hypothetical protein
VPEAAAARTALPRLNPQLLFHELSPRLTNDAHAVDVGSTHWYARHISREENLP